MKFSKYILCLLYFLLIISCDSFQEKNPRIELPTELRGCLITTELFEGEWNWESSSINIEEYNPTAENGYESSTVTTQIRRLSIDGKNRFDFATGLVSYEGPITTIPELKDNFSSSDIDLYPDFPPLNGKVEYFCSVGFYNNQYHSYGCQMQIVYSQHVFNLSHWGNSFVDIKTLEDFLNPYLEQFDSCISNLEK